MLKLSKTIKTTVLLLLVSFSTSLVAQGTSVDLLSNEVREISSTSATIVLESEVAVRTQIHYGTNPNSLSFRGAYNGRYSSGEQIETLHNLQPDTIYYYSVNVRAHKRGARPQKTDIKEFRTSSQGVATTTTLPTTTTTISTSTTTTTKLDVVTTTTTVTSTTMPGVSSPKLICPLEEIEDADFLIEWSDSRPAAQRNYDIFINGIDTGQSVSNVLSTQKNVIPYVQGLTGTFDLELLYFDNGDATKINSAGNCSVSYAFADGNVDDPTGRDKYWSSKGYTLQWNSTPGPNDLNSQTARNYFEGASWSNGQPIVTSAERHGAVEAAPDGSIAVLGFIPDGDIFSMNFRGTQLSQSSKWLNVVFSVETWVESETSRHYAGVGHNWGSRPGQSRSPGGGKNRDDAYSLRTVIAGSGNRAIYLYDCENTSYGETTVARAPLITGRWVLHEQEVRLNVPSSSSNGYIEILRDGISLKSINDRIRCFDDVYHKGAGLFVNHNSGAPVLQKTWMKNWKIYAK